ncbi:class IV adenylate cyclase [Patescibacteria group bacterium]|nr:class IV adenylate cyclase [Patescibacteria group bacterium]
MVNSEDIEIELKFEINKSNIDSFNKKLQNLGFTLEKRVHEISVMYDNPSKIMQITDGRIRLRKSGEKTILTYKKPLSRKGIKREIEYEVEVSDFNIMEKILKMMEFTKTTSYERYRTYFHKNNVEVMIDEFPYGVFIEIEGNENNIIKISNDLGFNMKNNLTDSCDTIYTKRCIEKGIEPSKHILFNKCNLP